MKRIGTRVRCIFLVVAMVAASLVTTSASGAYAAVDVSWSQASSLSVTGQMAADAQVGVSADGAKATAVWTRSDGSKTIVQSASATISGNVATWSAAIDLSTTGQDATTPQVEVSADGAKATAVWTRSDGSDSIVQSASATISGNAATWSAVTDLSATGRSAYYPQVGVSADGAKAMVVWTRSNGSNRIAQSASATISGNVATWSAVTDLSATGQNTDDPQVGLSSDGGKATAIWSRFDGSSTVVQSASATISGNVATWSAEVDVSVTGTDVYTPQLGISSDGAKATAVWHQGNGSNTIVRSASATISGTSASWSTVTELSQAGRDASGPQVGVSSDGAKATAVWFRNDGSYNIVQSASATTSGNVATWSSAAELSETGVNASAPQVGVSSDGAKATAVWYGYNGNNTVVQSSSSSISGDSSTWSSATDLSLAGKMAYSPQVGVSDDGTKATAVWHGSDGAYNLAQSASALIADEPTPPGPTPPGPSPEAAQTPVGGCVTAGTSLPRRGVKKLMKSGCETNAGQRVGVKVASATARGDLSYYGLFCVTNSGKKSKTSSAGFGKFRICKKGALKVRTNGIPLKMMITWKAEETTGFAAYTKSHTYKT